MPVIVNNLLEEDPLDVDLELLAERTVRTVLEQEGYGEESEVSVVFTDDKYIRELNRNYRGIDSPTDVLSFAMNDGEPMLGAEGEYLLGDVVISLQAAQRQGDEYGHGIRREVAYLAAHGALHLLGYDHRDEESRAVMREKEESAMATLGLGRDGL